MAKQDYYEILGVSKTAEEREIEKAYKRLAMKYHPDRNQGDKEAEAKFKEIKEAYEVLTDSQKRAAYDQYGHAAFEQGGMGGGGFGGGADFSDIFGDVFGDIFGGWLVSQMDLAGTAMASKVAGGRVATVAIDRMAFLVPVAVGAQLSFYTQALEIGRSSIQMMVEVWSDDPLSSEWRKVTEAVFVFVAIDGSGRTRSVPPRR